MKGIFRLQHGINWVDRTKTDKPGLKHEVQNAKPGLKLVLKRRTGILKSHILPALTYKTLFVLAVLENNFTVWGIFISSNFSVKIFENFTLTITLINHNEVFYSFRFTISFLNYWLLLFLLYEVVIGAEVLRYVCLM